MKPFADGRPIDVVILASGVNKIPLYDGYIPGYKALLPFHGRASLQYVLDSLLAIKEINHICIEGPRTLLETELDNRPMPKPVTIVEGGETFLDSVMIGLRQFADSPHVLFVTADDPLITTDAITEFLCRCVPLRDDPVADIYVSVVQKEFYTGHYAEFTKPFNFYQDVTVCHGNLFLLNPALLTNEELKERVTLLYDGRKSILSRFAFGWRVALTYLFGVELLHLIPLREMTALASRELGVKIEAVFVDRPEITMDVDEADDYRFVHDEIEWLVENREP